MKRWFISLLVALLVIFFVLYSYLVLVDYSLSWLGSWLTSAAGVVYFSGIYTFNKSSNNLGVTKYYSLFFYIGLIVTLYGLYQNPIVIQYFALGSSALLVVMWDKYLNWYSLFPPRKEKIVLNKVMPNGSLFDMEGSSISIKSLNTSPGVWLFYRGNWCPFCVAQIEELSNEYQEIRKLGYELRFVSTQSLSHSKSLASKLNLKEAFFRDDNGKYLDSIGLLDKAGLPVALEVLGYEKPVGYPAIVISNPKGKVSFIDITDNYRDRPESSFILDHLQNSKTL